MVVSVIKANLGNWSLLPKFRSLYLYFQWLLLFRHRYVQLEVRLWPAPNVRVFLFKCFWNYEIAIFQLWQLLQVKIFIRAPWIWTNFSCSILESLWLYDLRLRSYGQSKNRYWHYGIKLQFENFNFWGVFLSKPYSAGQFPCYNIVDKNFIF